MEGVAGCRGVIVIAGPGVEGGVLEGAGEREGDGPREWTILNDLGEIFGGLLDGLTARKENNAGEIFRDMEL